MSVVMPVVVIAIVIAIASASLFLLAAWGINREDRQMSLSREPRSPAESLGRRMVGVRVSQPEALRIFAGRRAAIAVQRTSPDEVPAGPRYDRFAMSGLTGPEHEDCRPPVRLAAPPPLPQVRRVDAHDQRHASRPLT
jgi:hypothetical protein